MHEIVKYFILTEIRSEIVNFRSRSDRGEFPRDLAHSRRIEQCMVADLSAGLGTAWLRCSWRPRGCGLVQGVGHPVACRAPSTVIGCRARRAAHHEPRARATRLLAKSAEFRWPGATSAMRGASSRTSGHGGWCIVLVCAPVIDCCGQGIRAKAAPGSQHERTIPC